MNPWTLEIITIRNGSHSGAERGALSRDVTRGLLIRIRAGAYVERTAFLAMTPEQQHIVRMRAFAAVADRPPRFSHWSAGVARGVPVLRERLSSVHTTVDSRSERGQVGVTAHLFLLPDDHVELIGDLLITKPARTAVDIADGGRFEEGVMAVDHVLHSGMARDLLETALESVSPRRSTRRVADAIAFGHAGAESAAESCSRVGMFRIGIEPPRLQHRLVLSDGSDAFLDFEFPSVRVGGEADGDTKYLAAPEGAGRAVINEKRREDEVRLQLHDLARWGWLQSLQPQLLRAVLAKVGVVPQQARPTLSDYAAEARDARPRWIPRQPVQR